MWHSGQTANAHYSTTEGEEPMQTANRISYLTIEWDLATVLTSLLPTAPSGWDKTQRPATPSQKEMIQSTYYPTTV